jgi:hypothetical protein
VLNSGEQPPHIQVCSLFIVAVTVMNKLLSMV